jgi:hypothetical protein
MLATAVSRSSVLRQESLIRGSAMVRAMFVTVIGPRLSALTAGASLTAEPGGARETTAQASPRRGARVTS